LYLPLIEDPDFDPEVVNVVYQEADPDSLLNLIKHFISIRKQNISLGSGNLEWAEAGSNPAILAFYRSAQQETILAVHNLSDSRQVAAISCPPGSRFDNLFGGERLEAGLKGILQLELKPYQYLWLKRI